MGVTAACLKTNDSLFLAVLTGCLRVAKESIFAGLNNFKVYSITDAIFGEYFGFLDREEFSYAGVLRARGKVCPNKGMV